MSVDNYRDRLQKLLDTKYNTLADLKENLYLTNTVDREKLKKDIKDTEQIIKELEEELTKLTVSISLTGIPHLFDPSNLEWLRNIGKKISLSQDDLELVFIQSYPFGKIPTIVGFSSQFERMIIELSKAPPQGQPELFPLLKFVVLISGLISGTKEEQELLKWVTNIAEDANCMMVLTEWRNQQNQAQSSPPSAPYLLIRISMAPQDKYRMRAWLFINGKHQNQAEFLHEDEPILRKELSIYLSKWLEVCGKYLGRQIRYLEIEFLLPNELFYEPIEQWEIAEDDNDFGDELERLGQRYQVLLRPSYRNSSNFRNDHKGWWHNKWDEFQQHSKSNCPPCKDCFFLWRQEQIEQKDLLNLKLRKVACLATTIPQAQQPSNLFKLLYRNGIPAALWIREHPKFYEASEVSDYFEKILTEKCLKDLPSKIFEMRSEAKSPKDMANYLALFWDDPYHVPPDLEFDEDYQLSPS